MVSNAIKKRLISPILKQFAKYYFSVPRAYSYKQIKGVILPGVFYPFFTISTKLLLEFIENLPLKNKSFLELGCGTGMISVLAAQKGAKVIASDINPKAIENVIQNAEKNKVSVEPILSDLFKNIPNTTFDYIIINPPYYPKSPQNKEEEAWFCGENFEYFKKLFAQLVLHLKEQTWVYMILSEDCAIESIQKIAKHNNIQFTLAQQRVITNEKNYIFRLTKPL